MGHTDSPWASWKTERQRKYNEFIWKIGIRARQCGCEICQEPEQNQVEFSLSFFFALLCYSRQISPHRVEEQRQRKGFEKCNHQFIGRALIAEFRMKLSYANSPNTYLCAHELSLMYRGGRRPLIRFQIHTPLLPNLPAGVNVGWCLPTCFSDQMRCVTSWASVETNYHSWAAFFRFIFAAFMISFQSFLRLTAW